MADWDHLSNFDLPPRPGSVPTPKGHVRLWHYSNVERQSGDERPWPQVVSGRANSLRHQGLRKDAARGESYGEPNRVWAAAGNEPPKNMGDKIFVETHAHPDSLDIGRGSSVEHLESHRSHVTINGNVSPHQFMGVHEPWHERARYLMDDERTMQEVQSGMHDNLMTDPDFAVDYGPAIRYVKSIRPQHGPRGGG